MKRRETGRFGENEACRYLRNPWIRDPRPQLPLPFGEIDMIAGRDGAVVFVEVKTRRDRAFAEAAQAVGPSKQERLRKTALMWLPRTGNGRRVSM